MEESYLAETATLQIIDSERKAKPFGPTRYSPFYTLHLSVLRSSQNTPTTTAFRGTVSVHLYVRVFQPRNEQRMSMKSSKI